MLLCGALFLLVGLAAFCAACRVQLDDRAEFVVAGSVFWSWLVIVPVYALGLSGTLTRANLVAATVALAVLVIGASCVRGGLGELLRQARPAAIGVLKLPMDALLRCWRDRSPAFLGCVFAIGFLCWNAISAYLAPAWRSWDALWYHEPMIGFTIQNQGFAAVPAVGITQKINGYPRLCEMTQLWFGLLADRRLIDLPNTLLAPALIAATYKLCHRLSGRVTTAIGWGTALLAMPACAHLLQTTFVDPQTAAYVLAAAHFSTRPKFGVRAAALASAALALSLAAKVLTLVTVAALLAIAFVRVLRFRPWKRTVLTLSACAVPLLFLAASTYGRNWMLFHNPFWPDLKVSIPQLGIDWPGDLGWQPNAASAYGSGIDMNLRFAHFLQYLFASPFAKNRGVYEQVADYGTGVVWVVLPLGLIACARAIGGTAVHALSGHARQARSAALTRNAALLAVVALATLVTSPALWSPRYHIASTGLFMALVAWLCASPRGRQLEHAAILTVQVTAITLILWAEPRWWISPNQMLTLARTPYPEREVRPDLGAPVASPFGLIRERELKDGDVVVVTDFTFPALLWNNRYSNVVRFIDNGPRFIARARELGASWLCCGGGACLTEARAAQKEWEEIGPAHPGNAATVFRLRK